MADGRAAGRLDAEFGAILRALAAGGTLSAQSSRRVADIAHRLERFARLGIQATSLTELTSADVRAFVHAESASGPAGVSTMHLRRTVVRLLFRTGRALGFVEGDPTLDLDLPRKTGLRARPLDDEEVTLCRSAALHTLTSTRLAAAWALAEGTARTAELPLLTVADLDLEAGKIWIHGSNRTTPRWGLLSDWGVVQLERHLETLPLVEPDRRLVYRGAGSAESRQASACIAIGEVLARAGLGAEADVRPVSVAAWVGRRYLEETGRIDDVARRLGMRSLDRTADLVGLDWRDR